jgi:mersacidin/lichenicidin family type 2 lantibiotic
LRTTSQPFDTQIEDYRMSNIDIIRAWKDEEYRRSLSAAERAALPEHPAGLIELEDELLGQVAGAVPSRGAGCTQNSSVWCTNTASCTNNCSVGFTICT